MLRTDTPIPERQRLGWLSADEAEHLRRLKSEAPRREYLATRVLCRATLSRYVGVDPAHWRFCAGRNGKPRIAGPRGFVSLRFNLTHTRGLVICLVTRTGEVGVDAEEIFAPGGIRSGGKTFFFEDRAGVAVEVAEECAARCGSFNCGY